MAPSEQQQRKQPALKIAEMGNNATLPPVTDQWHPEPNTAQSDPSNGPSCLLWPEVLVHRKVVAGGKHLGQIK